MGDFNELGPLDGRQEPSGAGGCLSVVLLFWVIVAIVWGLDALLGSL